MAQEIARVARRLEEAKETKFLGEHFSFVLIKHLYFIDKFYYLGLLILKTFVKFLLVCHNWT